ncbi:hypothetical protein PHLGIDRAFT_71277, partial [Phlebiopsis gigantea 11061_1 CR5-6]
ITQFQKHDIIVRYKDINHCYNLHCRPIWDWVVDQLCDTKILPYMQWDSTRLFTYNGRQWVSFFNEPFTACRAWNVQSHLPENGKPLGLIVYADKTKLSSFGTLKGYPVMMCISNLLRCVRNGSGVGGTRIVGWLPIVAEDKEHRGKTTFTNFKKVVWHTSFRIILDTIAAISQLGCLCRCADNVERLLFPFVHILVADYEEQCIMALTRGTNSKSPCTVCYVPASLQTKLDGVWDRRAAKDAQDIVWKHSLTLTQKESLLKPKSLRNIENGFWIVANSDPHLAIGIDRMHMNHGGNVSDHLWPPIQEAVEDLGRPAIKKVDNQMDMLPRWRNINHFRAVLGVHFTDARKYEDISKATYAAHDVLTSEASPGGYLLLQCMQAYVRHDMYLALEQHTEDTLREGRSCLLKFGKLIANYSEVCPSKDWNYPKFHANTHGYYDIEDKGVTANSNTKGFEKHHGPAKNFFNLEGNKKQPEVQVLRGEHRSLVALNMRADIDRWLAERQTLDPEEAQEPKLTMFQFGHVYLGSRQSPCSLSCFEDQHTADAAFQNITTRLTLFVNSEICSPQGLPHVRYQPSDNIIECRFLKVDFESLDNWSLLVDFLRCNPRFHGHQRNDGVILDMQDGQILFGQLLAIFACAVSKDHMEPVALIWPMDIPVGPRLQKDEDLGFYRLRARERHLCKLVSVRRIIRGAFLAQAYDRPNEFFAVDVVDTDMFLRFKGIFRF